MRNYGLVSKDDDIIYDAHPSLFICKNLFEKGGYRPMCIAWEVLSTYYEDK
jgi:hypothetical protein